MAKLQHGQGSLPEEKKKPLKRRTMSIDNNNLYYDLMTEDELIQFLRIPEVSSSKDYHNVVENLKRMHDLPRIHICGKPLYPLEAVKEWIRDKTTFGK